MGWSYRKSKKVGPVRLNFSKSGVSVSTGIKGLRYNVGPRGAYVTVGAKGFSYRQKISGRKSRHRSSNKGISAARTTEPHIDKRPFDPNHVDVSDLTDVTNHELVNGINAAIAQNSAGIFVRWGTVFAASLAAYALTMSNFPTDATTALPGIFILAPGLIWAQILDSQIDAKRTFCLQYDIDTDTGSAFDVANAAFSKLCRSREILTDAEDEAQVGIVTETPYLSTNVQPWAISNSFKTVYFFPDQILIYENNSYGAISYESLRVRCAITILEREGPGDAAPTQYEWTNAKLDGTPDRRYKDHQQLPRTEYARVTFATPTDVFLQIYVSNQVLAQNFEDTMSSIGATNPSHNTTSAASSKKATSKSATGQPSTSNRRTDFAELMSKFKVLTDLIASTQRVTLSGSRDPANTIRHCILNYAVSFMFLDTLENSLVELYPEILFATKGTHIATEEAEQDLRKRYEASKKTPTEPLLALLDLAQEYDTRNKPEITESLILFLRPLTWSILCACTEDTSGKLRWLDDYNASQPQARRINIWKGSQRPVDGLRPNPEDPPQLRAIKSISAYEFLEAFLLLDPYEFTDVVDYANGLASAGINVSLSEANARLRQKSSEPKRDPTEVLKPVFSEARLLDQQDSNANVTENWRAAFIERAQTVLDRSSHFTAGKSAWLQRFKTQSFDDIKLPPAATEGDSLKATIAVASGASLSVEDILKKLDDMVGLERVKKDVRDLVNFINMEKLRSSRGLPTSPASKHLVFYGNPGTGKTTVAKILAEAYRVLGVSSKGQCIDADRPNLVGGYLGQTALKVQEVVESAIGGVLFIDEAYALAPGEHDDPYGQEAINTLVKLMEDNRDDLIVIVAGYQEKMDHFIKSNPGLHSRFSKYFFFEDYSPDQLMMIFERFCNGAYTVDADAKMALASIFETMYRQRGEDFGNARDIRNIFDKVRTVQANRIISGKHFDDAEFKQLDDADLRRITLQDVQMMPVSESIWETTDFSPTQKEAKAES